MKPKAVKPESVLLRLLVQTKLVIPGPRTGIKYVFNGGGSEVMVDAEDVPQFMERTRPGSCCGGVPGPHPIFELVD